MKKPLGFISTMMVLTVSALLWTGCSGANSYCDDSCPPKCDAPCQPCDKPCDPCSSYGASGKISCDGVTVTATQPKLCILGDNYALDVDVKASTDVCHVEVHAMLPEGVTLVRSEPEGVKVEKGMLVWKHDTLKKGETKHSRIILRADREGNLCVCFCVTAVPVQFCKVVCAQPILECTKCGPEEVCPGDPVHYTITVTNRGSCDAEEVVVVDQVPEGLEHSSGQSSLTWNLCTLKPCETKKINVCFTAVKRGQVCNTINVTACNANNTSCQWCTNVYKECVEVTKVGPKERKVGESADYQITVTNPGDKPLTQVVLCDQAPSATSIVEAPGAVVNGNQAVWRFDELKPGQKETVNLTLTTCTPGYFVNRVSVDNCQRCRECAEWGTRWKGTPALNVTFGDSSDPVCIGDKVRYSVKVTNQGTEEDSNLKVVVRFPAGIAPMSTSGDVDGSVSGQTVTFKPVGVFGSRQTIEYIIEAQAKSKGDARVKAEVSSDYITTPITQEESTIVN